jgi:hypothetical protein
MCTVENFIVDLLGHQVKMEKMNYLRHPENEIRLLGHQIENDEDAEMRCPKKYTLVENGEMRCPQKAIVENEDIRDEVLQTAS